MLRVMNNSNNFDPENKDHTISKPRVSPDLTVYDETRVSYDDDVESDQNTPSGGDGKSDVSDYDSMLSMFDHYVTNGKRKVIGGRFVYDIGDMVWGKVKSHPWWPGHIYDEAFASASVRRSKRKGLVLVAFFGDSSYGWFDPDELIPFEPHFAEKSKQINSRTFVKAVEEASDEASRRRGLWLTCRCRNPYNFQPANVKGYVAFDVGDNEPAAVYSMDQIKKDQHGFRVRDVLPFVRRLAMKPLRDRRGNMDFSKDVAGILAHRRARFEEFDETYAQAFGQSPVQPSVESREALMHSVKAPLSGPMVIAETLAKKKTPVKSSKKDHAKSDGYLFKRRDEANKLKSQDTGKSTSSVQHPSVEMSAELADGAYILQRRTQSVSLDLQTPAELAVATEDKPSSLNDSMVMTPPSFDRFSDPTRGGDSLTRKGDQSKSSSNHDKKHAVTSKSVEGQDLRIKTETGTKKVNNLKRSVGDLGPDRSVTGEKKMKKKKDSDVIMSSDHVQKLGPAGELGPDRSVTREKQKKKKKDLGMKMGSDHMQKLGSAGKGVSEDKGSRKATKVDVDSPEKDVREDYPLPNSVDKSDLKLVDLLSGLHSLALDPFHGSEKNNPAFTRQAFLKFRSLVFQKSLALSTPSDVEPNEKHDVKPGKSFDIIHSATKDQLSSKTPKPLFRPEDPTKGSLKRGPSDRLEEVAAKRLRKVNEMKSLTVDKKAVGDGKKSAVGRPQKPLRAEPGKRMEAPRKIRNLTMLVMKFPPESTLPSENELKARLARFGPLDHSRMRIFWSTFMCRVVFIYKEDAEAAYRFLMENNMFGSVRVKCHTRPLETPAVPDLETKDQREDGPVERTSDFRVPATQSAVHIKSCLKKPTAGEAGSAPGGNGGSKGAARVKFVLGGGENSGGGEALVCRSNLNNTSFADVGNIGSSSSATSINATYGLDLISKNFQQKVVPQTPLNNSHSQVVSQTSNAPPIKSHFSQETQRTTSSKFNTNMSHVAQIGPSSTKTDFAREMLSLMARCNDVVVNLKSSLGYVPYHSL